ncbi:MAG TPA: hypothetical protein PKN96_07300 [Flavobacterium sp.]|uniref:hypothetical protein n=1 Tax=Flavobacterium sp. TaxID=239 RepID=UPI002C0FDB10|nr:hypothetical protein [Flavobacterium sp.]HNP33082.1 hypothetical protein [Flavobacterium sp.]
MKKIIVLILFLIAARTFAQYPILDDSIKKAGIYRTFEEFRDNNPSILVDFKNSKIKIDSEDREFAKQYGSEAKSIKVYGLNTTESAAKNIGFIFGFCDGKKIYVSVETERYSNYMSFYEINYLAPISYYEFMPSDLNDRGAINNAKTINLRTGKYKNLTVKYLWELISDKPELLERFRKERNQPAVLKDYLKEYLAK